MNFDSTLNKAGKFSYTSCNRTGIIFGTWYIILKVRKYTLIRKSAIFASYKIISIFDTQCLHVLRDEDNISLDVCEKFFHLQWIIRSTLEGRLTVHLPHEIM